MCTEANPGGCNPADACRMTGTCDASTALCSGAADGTPCTGGDLCFTNYACQAGVCTGTSPVVCKPADVCHTAGTCDPTTGCSNPAIPGCNSTPPPEYSPFETQASIIGLVQTAAGAAVTGTAVTVYDMPVSGPARTDVVVTQASDGSFRARLTTFPASEPPRTPPHHLMIFIDAPGFIRAEREVYAHPGTAVDLGTILVAARDPNTVMIGPEGGSVTDSQGLITVAIPPGALTAPTPITVTPIMSRDEMPAPLPPISLTGYGYEVEPSGTELAQPATVTIQNWRNVPTTTPMPGGAYDPINGGWKHVGMGSWNGSAWTYQIHHFSEQDLNPDEYGEWVLLMAGGQDPNGGATICGGSSISVGGGSVNQNIRLPTYRHRGRDYGVTLNYSSGLAGSRTLGTGPTSTKQAVPSRRLPDRP
jgi:hypothetical protein